MGEKGLLGEESLRKSARVTEHHDYKDIIGRGRVVSTGTFKAYFLCEDGLEHKAGFIAGKAVGKAHDRNRAKRLLREAYRKLKADLHPRGFRVVFVARPGIGKAGFGQIKQEMKEVFKKCNRWRR